MKNSIITSSKPGKMTIDLDTLYETIKSDKPNATEAEIKEIMNEFTSIFSR